MSNLIAEGLILVKSWTGHLDAPVPELRMIEKLVQELGQIIETSERRADLLLKTEAKIEKLSATEALIKTEKSYHEWLKPLEEIYFKNLMSVMNNNQSKTSEMAGLNRGTTRKKLKQCNLIQENQVAL
ncbi:MAG: hypothetical protein KAT69_07885 [Candidatus Aminicenantes bacterium]|nr:hypothetical protein [Candidatus Aminicenantes bacterium]